MAKFKVGDRVEVLDTLRYRNLHIGMLGTVRSVYSESGSYQVAVMIDGMTNTRSSYGCFYFAKNQIKHYEGDTLMEGNYKIATISFMDETDSNRTYRYALYDASIVPGDICVVKSAHHGFGIARIIDIEDKTDEKITREVICKCDFTDYETRENNRKRMTELKRKMAARAAALQELALFKMMAAEDSDMAELMREYNELEVF